jgi:hypothetical protein
MEAHMTNTPRESDAGAPPRMPRWVKVAAIVVGILVLVFVVLNLLGIGGEHGPGRHGLGPNTPPAIELEHRLPAGGWG